MTEREAINILDRRTTIPDDDCTFETINEAINMAISALECRTPGKPNWLGSFPWRPVCDREIYDDKNDPYLYCPRCGKRIDWTEYAEEN